MTNRTFTTLIESAIALAREGCDHARTTPDFAQAMEWLRTKQARLELRISFDPAPCVIGEIIDDADGQCIGHLFKHEARVQVVN